MLYTLDWRKQSTKYIPSLAFENRGFTLENINIRKIASTPGHKWVTSYFVTLMKSNSEGLKYEIIHFLSEISPNSSLLY